MGFFDDAISKKKKKNIPTYLRGISNIIALKITVAILYFSVLPQYCIALY